MYTIASSRLSEDSAWFCIMHSGKLLFEAAVLLLVEAGRAQWS